MNKVKILRCVLIVLIAATLVFIWSNSLQPREDSLEDSESVTNWVRPLLGALIGEENVTVHLVRKLAHFTEFALLGAELSCLSLLSAKRRLRGLLSCLAAGLFVGAIDESLQLLGDRGAQVQDVLLDFSGVLAAVLAIHLLAYLYSRRRTKD